jgi:hypothetical protein
MHGATIKIDVQVFTGTITGTFTEELAVEYAPYTILQTLFTTM